MRARHHRRLLGDEASDPLTGLVHLFDIAMVFAVALLFAFVAYAGLPELLDPQKELTVLKAPGTEAMEILIKKGIRLERYRLSREKLRGEGVRLGTAYRLKSGEVVYVPDR